MTFHCCKHCENPCPAIGHTKPCLDCKGNGKGHKQVRDAHFPPEAVRTWDPAESYIPAKALQRLNDQIDRLQAAQRLAS